MKNSLLLRFVFFATILFFTGNLRAQVPTTQDCRGAIAVCDYVYVEDSTVAGYGNYFEIPNGGSGCPNNHCMDGEHNSRWYIWTVVEAGDLRFQITPQVQTDDYDWAVFNITDHSCDDIYTNSFGIMSSCNAAGGAGYQGATGVNSLNGGVIDCNNGGPTNRWNVDLPVYEGETYVLVVSDWTQTPGGYTLDFSASTAVIFDDQKPFIEYIGGDLITACGDNELFIKFNEKVKCSSVQYYDFILEGPGGPYTIDSIYGETCNLGGNSEREYTLYTTPAIYQGGEFILTIKQLSFISDACNNYADPESYNFTIDLESPVADAGEDINIPYAATADLESSATGGSGNYTYSWQPAELLDDPTSPSPTTISLTLSTEFFLSVSDMESSCIGEDTMVVNVVGGPLSAFVSVNNNEICFGDRVDLSVSPDGGAGTYSYEWSSNPSGFTSTEQNPSDYPEDNIWYKVYVTDGYTDLYDSVLVTVNQLPIANAGDDQVINEGTTATLYGSSSGGYGNHLYQWEPSSWLESNNVPDPVTLPLYEPTVFTLIITDQKNCVSEPDNVLINASGGGLSAFLYTEDNRICFGESVTIEANASGGGLDYNYEWTSDPWGFESDQPDITVSPEEDTRYYLLLKDQFDNEFETYIDIIVNPLPVIDMIPAGAHLEGDTIYLCVRDTLVLDAGYDSDPPNTEYFWLDKNLVSRYYTASTNGNWMDYQVHSVRVTNGATGCRNTGEVKVFFDFSECEIGVHENSDDFANKISLKPNPNNGSFIISISNPTDKIDLGIYNNQGSLVYSKVISGDNKPVVTEIINSGLDSGIYFVRLTSGSNCAIKKMVIN